MNLIERTIWAELKFRVLESAMMLDQDYSKDEVMNKEVSE